MTESSAGEQLRQARPGEIEGGTVPVEVRIPTVFRKFTQGRSSIQVEPGTLAAIIDQMDQQHPGLKEQLLSSEGQIHRFVNVYVNDEDARYLEKLDTKVVEGDTVSLLPSVAGGR